MVKKLFSSLLLFVIMSIGNLYLSAYFHTLLITGSLYTPILTVSGFIITISYVIGNKSSGFFFLLEVASVCLIVYILYSQHLRHLSSDVRKITPDIITPVSAGHGEYGTARWQTEEEKKKSFKYIRLPSRKTISEYTEESVYVKSNIENSKKDKTNTVNTD